MVSIGEDHHSFSSINAELSSDDPLENPYLPNGIWATNLNKNTKKDNAEIQRSLEILQNETGQDQVEPQ